MRLDRLAEAMGLTLLTPELGDRAGVEADRGHVSDMLSDVLANAPSGGVLVTIQVHLNVVAVSVHAGLAAVIFAAGRRPEEAVRLRAVEEGILLYTARESAFDLVGKLHALGLRGREG